MLRKKVNLDEKSIVVYDDIFTFQENLEIYQYVCQLPFIRTNLDNNFDNNKDINIKWSCLLKDPDPMTNLLTTRYNQIEELANKDYQIFRQYVNFSTAETVDMIHVDSWSDTPGCYTMIHYANYRWDKNWHGETVFYNSTADEILLSTMIKPGRIVIFDSGIPHSARPPSSLTDFARYSIATKLIIHQEKNEQKL